MRRPRPFARHARRGRVHARPRARWDMPLTQPAGVLREALMMIRPFWPVAAFATASGALAGLASAWLLATINAGLHAPEGFTLLLALRFACLCAISVGGGAIAGVGNSLVGQKMIAALRKEVSARILRAPMATIERQRAHGLMAVLTSDIDTVSAFTFSFSGYAVAFAVAVGGFVYLFWLSPLVFALSAVANGLGVAVSFYSKRTWIRNYEGVRQAQDDLHKQYRAIIAGAKELRINRRRRAQIHETPALRRRRPDCRSQDGGDVARLGCRTRLGPRFSSW